MNIFIPDTIVQNSERKSLFLLTRPFLKGEMWGNDASEKARWGLNAEAYHYTPTVEHADAIFIPHSINWYAEKRQWGKLEAYNDLCKTHKIKAYAFISGDWGKAFPEFDHITYFRIGGFRSQLSPLNQGFPAALSDHHKRLFGSDDILIRTKKAMPVVGFCGHATTSLKKRAQENIKYLIENARRLSHNPFRKDWEPFFPSAYNRAKLMSFFEQSSNIETNFIYRHKYRGGATNQQEKEKTTQEYYQNIRNSDYILCVRGGGNFSIRLYETLMMGRIPVFLNTDCLLPFPDTINWKQHVVWGEWKDRRKLAKLVAEFHANLTARQFEQMQVDNRKLWKEVLSVKGIMGMLDEAGQKRYETNI